MSVYLYYNLQNQAYFITNMPLDGTNISGQNVLTRAIYASKGSKILPLYLFLLVKYCTRAINIYESVDTKHFLNKFDKITKKYMLSGQDVVGYEVPGFNRIPEMSSDAIWVGCYTEDGKIPTIKLNIIDLKFLLLKVKRTLGIDTIFSSLLTFWSSMFIFSANSLLFGLIPIIKAEKYISLFDIKFPIIVLEHKIYIYESFLQYFPLYIDNLGNFCSVTGVNVDGSVSDLPLKKIFISSEVLDRSSYEYLKNYMKINRKNLSSDLLHLLDFIDS